VRRHRALDHLDLNVQRFRRPQYGARLLRRKIRQPSIHPPTLPGRIAIFYQRKTLSTGENVGPPDLLPVAYRGLPNSVLADLAALGQPDVGYFVVVPEPEPPAPVRWIHKSVYLQRFTPEERITINEARAADPIIADLLYVLEQSEQIFLDLQSLIDGLNYLVFLGLLAPNRPAEVRA
jgi:hypothetical protein